MNKKKEDDGAVLCLECAQASWKDQQLTSFKEEHWCSAVGGRDIPIVTHQKGPVRFRGAGLQDFDRP